MSKARHPIYPRPKAPVTSVRVKADVQAFHIEGLHVARGNGLMKTEDWPTAREPALAMIRITALVWVYK